MKKRINMVVAVLCVPLAAKWITMPKVPIDRLIANTQSVLRQKPNEPEVYYMLGRLHSLQFALKTEVRARTSRGEVPTLDVLTGEHEPRQATDHLKPTDIESANQSLANYKRAVELAPDQALYHFGFGWMQQECSRFAGQLGTLPTSEWVKRALSEYRAAYRLALPEDQKSESHLRPYLAAEAGSAMIEILKSQPVNVKEIAEITRVIADLRRHPLSITPLLFSLNVNATLPDLLSNRSVDFDLDGFSSGRRWPWVRPDTCILVWDPDRTGQITSGRQLFGSVTFWMFWRNGYQALAALDDNHDGRLTGTELKGISVWRDANSNGIADPGEVVPAENIGIIEIAVKPNEIGRTLSLTHGMKLSDGTFLPTFDWLPESIDIDGSAKIGAPLPSAVHVSRSRLDTSN